MTSLAARERPAPPADRRCRLTGWASAPATVAAGVSGLLVLAVALLPDFATDLSAQAAWASFAHHHPTAVDDLSWFGGVYPASYSVATPYLMAAIGALPAGAVAAVAASATLASTFAAWRTRWARAAGVWVALATATALFAGQVTFLVGLAVAAAAVRLAFTPGAGSRPRDAAAAGLGALAALASPVAALFLGVAAAAVTLGGPRRAAGLLVGAATGLALLGVHVFFPQWGTQPTSWDTVAPAVVGGLLVAALVGRRHRTIAIGCALYAAGSAVAWLAPNPVGSNVARLALTVGAPLLFTLARRPAAILAIGGLLSVWLLYQPVGDLQFGIDPAASTASFYAPLLAELHARHAGDARVEVVPLADHWESYYVGAAVPLARGWERQLDASDNPLFYDGRLDAASYRGWLRAQAVGYVALADAPLDWAAHGEARLLRRGLPYLHLVWHGRGWSLWRVADPAPFAAGARVTATTPATVTVRVPRAEVTVVHVRYSAWLSVHGPPGACLSPAGAWTALHAPAAGSYRLGSSWTSLGSARCPAPRPRGLEDTQKVLPAPVDQPARKPR